VSEFVVLPGSRLTGELPQPLRFEDSLAPSSCCLDAAASATEEIVAAEPAAEPAEVGERVAPTAEAPAQEFDEADLPDFDEEAAEAALEAEREKDEEEAQRKKEALLRDKEEEESIIVAPEGSGPGTVDVGAAGETAVEPEPYAEDIVPNPTLAGGTASGAVSSTGDVPEAPEAPKVLAKAKSKARPKQQLRDQTPKDRENTDWFARTLRRPIAQHDQDFWLKDEEQWEGEDVWHRAHVIPRERAFFPCTPDNDRVGTDGPELWMLAPARTTTALECDEDGRLLGPTRPVTDKWPLSEGYLRGRLPRIDPNLAPAPLRDEHDEPLMLLGATTFTVKASVMRTLARQEKEGKGKEAGKGKKGKAKGKGKGRKRSPSVILAEEVAEEHEEPEEKTGKWSDWRRHAVPQGARQSGYGGAALTRHADFEWPREATARAESKARHASRRRPRSLHPDTWLQEDARPRQTPTRRRGVMARRSSCFGTPE
jgi:hypothetical protein